MTDLIEELHSLANSDPRAARLGVILGLALDEARQLAQHEGGPPRKPL